MSNLTDHLEFLFSTDTGYIYSPIKKRSGEWIQKWFTWPLERGNLQDWIKSEALESDVYLSPVIWKEKKITPENVSHSNVVWIEFDGSSSVPKWDKGIPEPDLIIQTSVTSHLHCYWRIPASPVEIYEDINHRLTYFLEADASGYDYQQVLRPPDTINYKHNLPVTLTKFVTGSHGVEEFDAAPKIEKLAEFFTYENLLEVKDVIKDNKLDGPTINKIMNELVVHPHRSEFLMHMGHNLAEMDLDALEIVTCLYHIDCRIKKFVGREDQLRRLSEIASKAIFKVEQKLYISVYSPKDILNHTVDLEFMIPGYLHTTGMMIISGSPSVGKTQWCLDLAYRLTTGDSVLGLPAFRPLRVAFLSLEMDVSELKVFFVAQVEAFSKTEMWNENMFIIAPDIDEGLSTLEKTLKELNPDVLIIDSISELASEDLNETETRKIMRWMKKVRKTITVGIVAIHHNRKASDSNKKPRKLSDLYGSFLFGKSSDTVICLWQEEGRELIEADTLKHRYAKFQSYRLKRTENLTFETEATFSVNIVTEPTPTSSDSVFNFG